jgi:hypothetical protein
MPCKTTWESHGILWEYHGEVTGDEIDTVNSRFFKDERRFDVDYQIIDASRVTGTDWNARDAHLIAAKDFGVQQEVQDLKLAFIATEPAFSALVDEYIAISERLDTTWEFRRFDTVEDARKWVDG